LRIRNPQEERRMASPSPETTSMALFCDFENVALGVRDAKYEKFDIKRVLERLLLKGSIVVKKAYCDWDRYKGFKATMHEANFELIEIPHVRQSGKNSADIRLVVDALDLCYTKSHVNTFVIISGDSDFSPLVSKLRENAKQVIGVGVKQSTSDLLIANCDEFIFYDDLVRDSERAQAKRAAREGQPQPNGGRGNDSQRKPDEDRRGKSDAEARRLKAIDLVVETFEALISERGDSGKIRASVVKDALKRRQPHFNESYHGFRTFGSLLEEAEQRGLLELERDDKANVYVCRKTRRHAPATQPAPERAAPAAAQDAAAHAAPPAVEDAATPAAVNAGGRNGRPRGRGERGARREEGAGPQPPTRRGEEAPTATSHLPASPPNAALADLPAETATGAEISPAEAEAAFAPGGAPEPATAEAPTPAKRRTPRKTAAKKTPRKTSTRRSPATGAE
jgi:uncharacterized LabA/DUF88 family protein